MEKERSVEKRADKSGDNINEVVTDPFSFFSSFFNILRHVRISTDLSQGSAILNF